MLEGIEEEVVVDEDGGPGGIRQGGGGEQQSPQLVQDTGGGLLFALPYGIMLLDALGRPRVNSGTKSTQGPWTETKWSQPTQKSPDQGLSPMAVSL